ncbi:MAG TPA: CPBP family intramembrane glutamic endopeptidase, partial [Symbiobacteriaceae bacterium]|nr:CPBP family intramembrane glutamic endopeptidase [Symbiobacteriaceae bacterium]
VDSLRSRYNLLTTSLLFALLWGLWHVPMFAVNTTYQHELWKMGIPYVLNFFVSLLPFTIIVNWLYYKTNRSILTAILFHVVAVVSPEAFSVEESTKFIQTGILLVIAVAIVVKDRAFSSAYSAPNLIESRRSA